MVTAEQILTPELLNALRNYREWHDRYEETGSKADELMHMVSALELASELDCILEAAGVEA